MSIIVRSFLGLIFFTTINNALKLPSYIEPCSRSDPNINDCAMKSAVKAIPHLLKGEPKYHLPSLEPLIIPEVQVDNAGLKINLKNVEVRGFDKTRVVKIHFDQNNVETTVTIPELDIKADYDISGRVLLLPVSGKGPATMKVYNGYYTVRFNYTQFERKGKTYGKIQSNSVDFDVKEKMTFNFENLFGNKELSDQMNTFLNENWKELIKEIGPSISESVNVLVTELFGTILDKVPVDEIFLP